MAVDTSRQIDTGGEDLIVRDLFVNATSAGAAGTKVLNAGVVTAPLQPSAGTATVPPIKFTSGTSLTTPATGVLEYDGSAFYATAQASARQAVDAEQFVVLQADLATTASTPSGTGAAIFSSGASTLTLAAGEYFFESQLYNVCSQNTSVALTLGFSGTATPSVAYQANGVTSTGGGSSIAAFGITVWQNSSTLVAVTNTSSSATANTIVSSFGTLNVSSGANGTFIPTYSCAQNSMSAGAVTWKAGSFFRVWGIAPASTASVGRWS